MNPKPFGETGGCPNAASCHAVVPGSGNGRAEGREYGRHPILWIQGLGLGLRHNGEPNGQT